MAMSSNARPVSQSREADAVSQSNGISMPRGAQTNINFTTGELKGDDVKNIVRTIGELRGIFRDGKAWQALDPNAVAYRVQTFSPIEEGVEGGLLWGTTFIEPGVVGDEYLMTKGHFHGNRSRGEFYLTIAGTGALILMDENRRTVFEPMHPGSLHYVRAHTAHRTANTGESVLAFQACWPSDSGHDYESIARDGFSARLRKVGGVPTLVEEP